jgi:large subunit ribosomal protein L32
MGVDVWGGLFRREGLQAAKRAQNFFAKLKARALAECPNCGEMTMPHRVCPYCGYYKGKQVLNKI